MTNDVVSAVMLKSNKIAKEDVEGEEEEEETEEAAIPERKRDQVFDKNFPLSRKLDSHSIMYALTKRF
jgi:hypothetical protein